MPDPEPAPMFEDGSDLPLFSGTPQRIACERFEPREVGVQAALPGMPAVDLEHVYRKDNAARLGRQVLAYRDRKRVLCLACAGEGGRGRPIAARDRAKHLRGLVCAGCGAVIFTPAWETQNEE